TYDSINRLIQKTPDASLGEPTVALEYTATGRRSRMIDASGISTYAYDERDRLITKTTPQGSLFYTYDPVGNLLSLRSAAGNGVSIDYAYAAANRLTTILDSQLGSATTTYDYDANGNVIRRIDSNGTTTNATYDLLNRLTGVAITRGAVPLATFDYTL